MYGTPGLAGGREYSDFLLRSPGCAAKRVPFREVGKSSNCGEVARFARHVGDCRPRVRAKRRDGTLVPTFRSGGNEGHFGVCGPSLWVEGASPVAGVGVIGSSSGPTDRRWAFSPVLHQIRMDPHPGRLRRWSWAGVHSYLAVAVGFEPTVESPPHTLSRRAP